MAKEREFIYSKTKEVGKLGNATVEIGHYIVDGKEMADKVYLVTSYVKKDGTEHSKATAICTVAEAKELGKLLSEIQERKTMWTPCDEPVEEYNEETGKMEIQHHCPYADTYVGYEDEMCRNCCGLGVDE